MNPEEAAELSQALTQVATGNAESLKGAWRIRADYIQRGVPVALGLTNDEWSRSCFGAMIQLADDERKEAAQELTEEGMSQREIAAALGVGKSTINRDLNPVVPDGTEDLLDQAEDVDPVPDGTVEELADELTFDEEPETEEPQEIDEDTVAAYVAEIDKLVDDAGGSQPNFTQRVQTGKLTWTEAQLKAAQWKKQYDADVGRHVKAIMKLNESWGYAASVLIAPTRIHTTDVLSQLGEADRDRFKEVVTEIVALADQLHTEG